MRLFGVSSISGDMRELLTSADPRAAAMTCWSTASAANGARWPRPWRTRPVVRRDRRARGRDPGPGLPRGGLVGDTLDEAANEAEGPRISRKTAWCPHGLPDGRGVMIARHATA